MCHDTRCPIPHGLCHCGCGQKAPLATKMDASTGRIKGQPMRFVSGHNRRKSPVPYTEQDCGYHTPCWVWLRALTPKGYGSIGNVGSAHRWYYEQRFGPLAEDTMLDHLCRNRACVNPAHLEPVTNTVNVRRGLSTKLTESQVREILASSESLPTLAIKYGVTKQRIWQIRHRHAWVDLT